MGADGSFTISPLSTAKQVTPGAAAATREDDATRPRRDRSRRLRERRAAAARRARGLQGAAIGKLDSLTVEALTTAWQDAQGIQADGQLTADTVKALQKEYGC